MVMKQGKAVKQAHVTPQQMCKRQNREPPLPPRPTGPIQMEAVVSWSARRDSCAFPNTPAFPTALLNKEASDRYKRTKKDDIQSFTYSNGSRPPSFFSEMVLPFGQQHCSINSSKAAIFTKREEGNLDNILQGDWQGMKEAGNVL
ncbi:hypothetical protein DV515_00010248 [Chloebia gouldiae]|uniref:Uncharacterized protein n=1 Tax=Chloebia gouldiae TaxID=44316 RepID=A0A3L8SAI6_CHLGU|nr:hypothetical protein DV515_00010248 [Chloebia gouldiae]